MPTPSRLLTRSYPSYPNQSLSTRHTFARFLRAWPHPNDSAANTHDRTPRASTRGLILSEWQGPTRSLSYAAIHATTPLLLCHHARTDTHQPVIQPDQVFHQWIIVLAIALHTEIVHSSAIANEHSQPSPCAGIDKPTLASIVSSSTSRSAHTNVHGLRPTAWHDNLLQSDRSRILSRLTPTRHEAGHDSLRQQCQVTNLVRLQASRLRHHFVHRVHRHQGSTTRRSQAQACYSLRRSQTQSFATSQARAHERPLTNGPRSQL